jgi:hypothetical protein
MVADYINLNRMLEQRQAVYLLLLGEKFHRLLMESHALTKQQLTQMLYFPLSRTPLTIFIQDGVMHFIDLQIRRAGNIEYCFGYMMMVGESKGLINVHFDLHAAHNNSFERSGFSVSFIGSLAVPQLLPARSIRALGV